MAICPDEAHIPQAHVSVCLVPDDVTCQVECAGHYSAQWEAECQQKHHFTNTNILVYTFCFNFQLINKLSPNAPPKPLVERYLIEIARNYNVPYEPDQSAMVRNITIN
jgi:hypothetical protein